MEISASRWDSRWGSALLVASECAAVIEFRACAKVRFGGSQDRRHYLIAGEFPKLDVVKTPRPSRMGDRRSRGVDKDGRFPGVF